MHKDHNYQYVGMVIIAEEGIGIWRVLGTQQFQNVFFIFKQM